MRVSIKPNFRKATKSCNHVERVSDHTLRGRESNASRCDARLLSLSQICPRLCSSTALATTASRVGQKYCSDEEILSC